MSLSVTDIALWREREREEREERERERGRERERERERPSRADEIFLPKDIFFLSLRLASISQAVD